MKQLFLLFSFVLVASLSANAQSCNKGAAGAKMSCCASKKAAAVDTKADANLSEADAAMAASNGTITKKTCQMSGNTTYFEKAVNAETGEESWAEVEYDSATKTFTRVASASMEKDENGNKVQTKACAGQEKGKSCCSAKKG